MCVFNNKYFLKVHVSWCAASEPVTRDLKYFKVGLCRISGIAGYPAIFIIRPDTGY